jgi:hypothetical protein
MAVELAGLEAGRRVEAVGVRIRELAELEGSDVGLESELSRISGARGSELRHTRLGIRSRRG